MSIVTIIAKGNATLTHERQSGITGTSGARKPGNWTLLASNVPCWLQPASSSTVERFAAQQMTVGSVVFTAADLSALANDRFKIRSRYYLVRGVVDQAGLARVFAYAVEELR